jgi:type II secretory pathway pseudopilin PulG
MTVGRRRAEGQAGITMVEMAVVIALLGLVLAMAMQGLVSYQRAAASADTRQQNLEEARTVMAVATKDLRTATEFCTTGATDVTFMGLLNTGPTAAANKIQLVLDTSSTVLKEVVTPPDSSGANSCSNTVGSTTRVVGQGLPAASSLFSYRDSSDNVTTTLTAITSVVVTVSVDLPSRSGVDVPATVLTSRVFLPNVAASASEA